MVKSEKEADEEQTHGDETGDINPLQARLDNIAHSAEGEDNAGEANRDLHVKRRPPTDMLNQVSRHDRTDRWPKPKSSHSERQRQTPSMDGKEAIQNGGEGGLHQTGTDTLQQLKHDQRFQAPRQACEGRAHEGDANTGQEQIAIAENAAEPSHCRHGHGLGDIKPTRNPLYGVDIDTEVDHNTGDRNIEGGVTKGKGDHPQQDANHRTPSYLVIG